MSTLASCNLYLQSGIDPEHAVLSEQAMHAVHERRQLGLAEVV